MLGWEACMRQSGTDDCSDLLARLRAKQEDAYLEFVRMWAPRFERDFRKHGFAPADAYDLSFSCVTQVLTKLGFYKRDADGFDGWILTVGRNFAEDWRRKNDRLRLVPLPASLVAPQITAPEDEPEIPSVRLAPALAALVEALAQLPIEDQKLVELRYLSGSAGFSVIAKELSINGNAARTRHHRILKRLKDLLERDERVQRFL
jgi:RNA polymerase sigma-70 factor, ECF subfamily